MKKEFGWDEWFGLTTFIAWCRGTRYFVSEILEKKKIAPNKIRYKVKVGWKEYRKVKRRWVQTGWKDVGTAVVEVDTSTEPWGIRLVEWKVSQNRKKEGDRDDGGEELTRSG